jgi:hypothetical protein
VFKSRLVTGDKPVDDVEKLPGEATTPPENLLKAYA